MFIANYISSGMHASIVLIYNQFLENKLYFLAFFVLSVRHPRRHPNHFRC